MATHRLLDTRTTSFGELLGNGRRYQVPTFQRDYAWTEENWEELWQDILTSYEMEEPHFMGAIVTQIPHKTAISFRKGNRILIVDGQQRLTTLSILVIAVIYQLQVLINEECEPEANRERQEILRRTYLGDRDPGSLRYSSKLALNENDDGFYQNNLVNLRVNQDVYGVTTSERKLWQSFQYFSRQLAVHPVFSRDGSLLATLLTDTVAKQLVFIQISIEDGSNAYVLFETLNSRGVELGIADLLKNYIFSLLKGPVDHAAGRYDWQKIVRTVGMTKFSDFLKCYLSMRTHNVRQARLFKATRESIQDAAQALDLLSSLSQYSELYVALSDENDDFWLRYNHGKLTREYVRQLGIFKAFQTYPVLMAAFSRFDENKFEKLLKVLTVLAFRYLVVGGLTPHDLEKNCNLLAIDISEGRVKSPRAAYERLASVYVQDEKFQQDFSVLILENQRQKKLVKYILRQLERYESGRDIPEESFSVEHILPQNPNEAWQQTFSKTNLSRSIYRLGNLTPLEANLNSALGRADFSRKRVVFAKSVYAMTRELQYDEWTANAITFRQEEMAKQAVKIWRIDY
ncbi:MAG: DUF262 domain-containing protein [Cyanobacteria bacterium J06626_6]